MFYKPHTTVIHVPALEKSLTFLHLSDLHISHYDAASTETEIQTAKEKEANWDKTKKWFCSQFHEEFNSEHENTDTVAALDKLIDYYRSGTYDAVLMTGDVLDYPHRAGEQLVTEKLKEITVPIIRVPGNHDALPKKMSSMQAFPFGNVCLAAFDNNDRHFDEEQLRQLQACVRDYAAVFIVAHIPLQSDYNRDLLNPYGSYFSTDPQHDATRAFVDYCIQEEKIKGIFCGHTHGFLDMELAPGTPMICASAGMTGNVHIIKLA